MESERMLDAGWLALCVLALEDRYAEIAEGTSRTTEAWFCNDDAKKIRQILRDTYPDLVSKASEYVETQITELMDKRDIDTRSRSSATLRKARVF